MTTRANCEATLIKRAAALMTVASLDASTADGTNSDLADPLAWAISEAGGTVADITDPTDAEVGSISDAFKLLALAEFRLLENIAGNLDCVDTTLGPRSEKLSQLATALEKRMARLSDTLKKRYGYGGATLAAGVLSLNIASHSTDGVLDE